MPLWRALMAGGGGGMLRTLREDAGLTQRQIGALLGISQPAVSQIETGGDGITWATVLRYLTALGFHIEVWRNDAPARGRNLA